MKKVLMVGNHPSVKGGITTVITQMLNHDWNKDNIKLEFVSTYIEKNSILKIIFFIVAYIKILYNFIFFRPDVVHIHMSYKGSYTRANLIVNTANIFKIKYIIHLHGSEFEKWFNECHENKKRKIRKMLKNSYKFIVLGEKWKNVILSIEPDTDVFVLNNAIKETPKKCMYNEKINILFLGVMIKRKGIYDIIDIIRKNYLLLKNNKVTFILSGSGKEEENLKRIVYENNFDDIVCFTGWINDKEKEKIILKSQFMLLPSYNEGLPMAILESMAYGLPIIASNVGDISEAVENGKNGFLIRPGNLNDLDEIIKKIINIDFKLWNEMSEYSKYIINKKFSEKIFFEKINSIYNLLF